MKKMKKIVVAIASTIVMAGSAPQLAFAGQYIWGTPSANSQEARESAYIAAKEVVKSRKKGCVGPGKNDHTTQAVVQRQNGDKVQYGVFISHYNKSCGKKAGLLGDIDRELNGDK